MKKSIVLLLFSISVLTSSFSQFSPGYYALKDVSMIDIISKKVFQHYTIIIHNNLIETIGPVKEIAIPDSVSVFNYPGKYVMPGLIDTHEHLATEPTKDANRIRAEKDLKVMLLSAV